MEGKKSVRRWLALILAFVMVFSGSAWGSITALADNDDPDPVEDPYVTIDGQKYDVANPAQSGVRFIQPKYSFSGGSGANGTESDGSQAQDGVVTAVITGYETYPDGNDNIVNLSDSFTIDKARSGLYMYIVWYQAKDATHNEASITRLTETKLRNSNDGVASITPATGEMTNNDASLKDGLYLISGIMAGECKISYAEETGNAQSATITVTDSSTQVEDTKVEIDGKIYSLPNATYKYTNGIYAVKASYTDGKVAGFDNQYMDGDVVILSNAISLDVDGTDTYYLFYYKSNYDYNNTESDLNPSIEPITDPSKDFDDGYVFYINSGNFTFAAAEVSETAPFTEGAWKIDGKKASTNYINHTFDAEGSKVGESSLTITVGDGDANTPISQYSEQLLVKSYECDEGGAPRDTDEVDVIANEGSEYNSYLRRATGYADKLDIEGTNKEVVIRIADAQYGVLEMAKANQILRPMNKSGWKITYYDEQAVSAASVTDPRNATLSGQDVTDQVLQDYTYGEATDSAKGSDAPFLKFKAANKGYYVVTYNTSTSYDDGNNDGNDSDNNNGNDAGGDNGSSDATGDDKGENSSGEGGEIANGGSFVVGAAKVEIDAPSNYSSNVWPALIRVRSYIVEGRCQISAESIVK